MIRTFPNFPDMDVLLNTRKSKSSEKARREKYGAAAREQRGRLLCVDSSGLDRELDRGEEPETAGGRG